MLKNIPGKWAKTNQESESPPASQQTAQVTSPQDAISQLQDPQEKKRLAACLEIKDTELLLKTSRTDSSEKVRRAAARQYARNLANAADARQLVNDYAAQPDNVHLARLIAALHNDADIREHGLSKFNTDADFADIAVETRFHDTRDQVTGQIQSLDVVDQVWRSIKSKDKIVARKLKDRLGERQKDQLLKANQLQEVEKITEEMDKLAHGVWSPNTANRFELFDSKWQALDFEIDATQQSRFESLKKLAQEKVASNQAIQKQHTDAENIVNTLQDLCKSLCTTSLVDLPVTLDNVKKSHRAIVDQWQAPVEALDAEVKLAETYTKSRNRLEFLLSKSTAAAQAFLLTQTGNTANNTNQKSQSNDDAQASTEKSNKDNPTAEPSLTALIKQQKQLQNAIEALKNEPDISYRNELPDLLQLVDNKVTEQNKANNELKTSIHKQLGSLNSAISANRWGPAKSIHERLQKKIARLPAKQRTAYTDKLEKLEKRLTELGDWKQFATEPKLEALCEQMEKLPSLKLSLKDQADRIKELQNQWKAMGANPAADTHWPRFKAAADIAYEPCGKYFAQKRTEKQQKIGKRTEILQMLNTYVDKSDWENPDWKLVEKTIRTAKNEWRNHRVFDRKAAAKQEQQFTDVLARLNEKLEPAYESGLTEKTELIEKVKTLGEGDINQHCINQVKRLQSMWRRTGLVKRSDDQRLWKEFNEACSAIYNTHRGKQKEQYAASVEHVTRAKQIIKELKQAGNDSQNFDEKKLQQIQDEFQSLPEFPEKEQKYIFRDFNRAVDGLDKQRQKLSETSKQLQVTRLHHNAAICDQLEGLAGQSTDTVTTQMTQLLDDWEDGDKSDNAEWKKAMNLRRDSIVAHLQNATLPDFEANTHVRRLLCIDLEVLLDRETPPGDKPLRMQHQLQQLQEGLSSNALISVKDQVKELEVKWLTSFPADADSRDKLNTRFATALAQK